MPANISFENGRANAFTSLSPAWWDRNGEYVTDQHLTSEQVWGERGVLNFEYELRTVADAETGKVLNGYRQPRRDEGDVVSVGECCHVCR